MTILERQVHIKTDRHQVWAVISNLEDVAAWNPGVVRASCAAARTGIGATRRSELTLGGTITEVVTEWIPGRELWLAVGNHGAIRSADFGLVLDEASNEPSVTVVRAVVDWHLNYGPIGAVIDQLTVRRHMAAMLESKLTGLKEMIESAPVAGITQLTSAEATVQQATWPEPDVGHR